MWPHALRISGTAQTCPTATRQAAPRLPGTTETLETPLGGTQRAVWRDATVKPRRWLSHGLRLGAAAREFLDDVVNDGVDEHEADRHRRTDLLLLGEHLPGDSRHPQHHNDALGRVGDRGGDGTRRLDRHRRELIVEVEGHA